MRTAWATTVLTAASAAAVPSSPQAPPQVPVFGSEVELITVDAVVINKFGKAVGGLTRDDFQVSEDGRPVEIVRFEAVVEPEEEQPSRRPPCRSRTRRPRTSRDGRRPAADSRS